MNNEKLDNLLNLALDADPRELEESPELNEGFDKEERTWQVIVKGSGGFQQIMEIYPEIRIRPLLNGYAIFTIPQDLLEEVSLRPEIEYIEKPRRLFFAANEGRRASCVNPLQAASGISLLLGNGAPGADADREI